MLLSTVLLVQEKYYRLCFLFDVLVVDKTKKIGQ